MVNSPSFDIVTLLVNEGIIKQRGTAGSLPIAAIGHEPDVDKEDILTVYDTGSWRQPNPAWGRDHPLIQVRVKAGEPFDYLRAYEIQQQVKDFLLGRPRQTINDTLYVGFWGQGDIFTLGADRDNRPVLVANYRLVREYETDFRKKIE